MCGRYNLITDAHALIDFFELSEGLAFSARYNIAPSQSVPAIRQHDGERRLAQLRWGLIPFWAKTAKIGYSTINARAETLAEKPAFRAAFRQRRCLIPATGFYEWQAQPGGKQPYHITVGDGELFAFAGLWERWQSEASQVVESCSIIVTQANEKIAAVHQRMPVILDPGDYDTWLDATRCDKNRLKALLRPYPAQRMTLYPVSTRVNKPANDDSACITPMQSTRLDDD